MERSFKIMIFLHFDIICIGALYCQIGLNIHCDCGGGTVYVSLLRCVTSCPSLFIRAGLWPPQQQREELCYL